MNYVERIRRIAASPRTTNWKYDRADEVMAEMRRELRRKSADRDAGGVGAVHASLRQLWESELRNFVSKPVLWEAGRAVAGLARLQKALRHFGKVRVSASVRQGKPVKAHLRSSVLVEDEGLR